MDIPFTEVFDALRGDCVVVVLPRELSFDETLGGQTLQGLDDFEVRNIEIFVFWEVIVLFCYQDTLWFKLSALECPE